MEVVLVLCTTSSGKRGAVATFVWELSEAATGGALKQGVLKNLAKFKGKHLCQSLFSNKVEDLRSATLLKKRLRHRCFHVNLTKFLKTLILKNI